MPEKHLIKIDTSDIKFKFRELSEKFIIALIFLIVARPRPPNPARAHEPYGGLVLGQQYFTIYAHA